MWIFLSSGRTKDIYVFSSIFIRTYVRDCVLLSTNNKTVWKTVWFSISWKGIECKLDELVKAMLGDLHEHCLIGCFNCCEISTLLAKVVWVKEQKHSLKYCTSPKNFIDVSCEQLLVQFKKRFMDHRTYLQCMNLDKKKEHQWISTGRKF